MYIYIYMAVGTVAPPNILPTQNNLEFKHNDN